MNTAAYIYSTRPSANAAAAARPAEPRTEPATAALVLEAAGDAAEDAVALGLALGVPGRVRGVEAHRDLRERGLGRVRGRVRDGARVGVDGEDHAGLAVACLAGRRVELRLRRLSAHDRYAHEGERRTQKNQTAVDAFTE
jgi:hypothetical protein